MKNYFSAIFIGFILVAVWVYADTAEEISQIEYKINVAGQYEDATQACLDLLNSKTLNPDQSKKVFKLGKMALSATTNASEILVESYDFYAQKYDPPSLILNNTNIQYNAEIINAIYFLWQRIDKDNIDEQMLKSFINYLNHISKDRALSFAASLQSQFVTELAQNLNYKKNPNYIKLCQRTNITNTTYNLVFKDLITTYNQEKAQLLKKELDTLIYLINQPIKKVNNQNYEKICVLTNFFQKQIDLAQNNHFDVSLRSLYYIKYILLNKIKKSAFDQIIFREIDSKIRAFTKNIEKGRYQIWVYGNLCAAVSSDLNLKTE